MKSKHLLIIACLTALNGTTHSQENLIFSVGADMLAYYKYNNTSNGVYELEKPGTSLGMLIPIKNQWVDLHYKIGASSHKIANKHAYSWHSDEAFDGFDRHASALNELLIGRRFRMNHKMTVLPQIGIGFQAETLYRNQHDECESIVYTCGYVDLSLMVVYRLKRFGIGILINRIGAIWKSTDVYEASNRSGLSVVLAL